VVIGDGAYKTRLAVVELSMLEQLIEDTKQWKYCFLT
jgi:hypothetical protein